MIRQLRAMLTNEQHQAPGVSAAMVADELIHGHGIGILADNKQEPGQDALARLSAARRLLVEQVRAVAMDLHGVDVGESWWPSMTHEQASSVLKAMVTAHGDVEARMAAYLLRDAAEEEEAKLNPSRRLTPAEAFEMASTRAGTSSIHDQLAGMAQLMDAFAKTEGVTRGPNEEPYVSPEAKARMVQIDHALANQLHWPED